MSTHRQTDTNLLSTGPTGILALQTRLTGILHRDTREHYPERAHFVSASRWIVYTPYLGD
jgi:hypothetical protein